MSSTTTGTSLDALKREYRQGKAEQEKRREFFVYAVYRPLSFLVTPAFLRAGFSANAVSLIGLGLALLMPVFALDPERGYLWLALSSFCCLVLDCVDGNVARTRGASSALGRYLDSIGGKAYTILVLISLGILAAGEVPALGPGTWLCIALAAALLYLWARESRSYAKLFLIEEQDVFAAGPIGIKHLAPAIPDLLPFGLLLLGPFESAYLLLCGLAVLYAANFLYTQLTIYARVVR